MTSYGESYVAVDLGAESGRIMLATLTNDHLDLQEIYRFKNGPVRVGENLYWNPLYIWDEIKKGLAEVARRSKGRITGIGLDAWGLDFALVGRDGSPLGFPHHSRDTLTNGSVDELLRHISHEELYRETGGPGSPIRTLCQLLAMKGHNAPALGAAHRLLMIPDLFNYWLCGRQASEATIAGTTQFYNLTTHDWHRPLLERLGLPTSLLAEIIPTATTLDRLLPAVADEVGLDRVVVSVPACHDTACAMAAVPALGSEFTAISSGTWSVIGTELDSPVLTTEAMAAQLLNQEGAFGKTLFAVHSTGMWPLQECRREWVAQGHNWTYTDLAEMAANAPCFTTILNPDAPDLFGHGQMTNRIAAFCAQTRQQMPRDAASLVRSLLEGLALRYRRAIEDLDRATNRSTTVVHIVGGGSRNTLLCQLTADATGLPVVAGPSEATASGNALLQALAAGSVGSFTEVRQIVTRSAKLEIYEPHRVPGWDDAYLRFLDFFADQMTLPSRDLS